MISMDNITTSVECEYCSVLHKFVDVKRRPQLMGIIKILRLFVFKATRLIRLQNFLKLRLICVVIEGQIFLCQVPAVRTSV